MIFRNKKSYVIACVFLTCIVPTKIRAAETIFEMHRLIGAGSYPKAASVGRAILEHEGPSRYFKSRFGRMQNVLDFAHFAQIFRDHKNYDWNLANIATYLKRKDEKMFAKGYVDLVRRSLIINDDRIPLKSRKKILNSLATVDPSRYLFGDDLLKFYNRVIEFSLSAMDYTQAERFSLSALSKVASSKNISPITLHIK